MRTILCAAAVILAAAGCSAQPTLPQNGARESLPTTRPLAASGQGAVVLLPDVKLDAATKIPLTMEVGKDSPQFIFSDMPEYFRTGNGIALQEDVKPGLVRMYVYHVPEPTGEKRVISAVVENLSDAPMTLRFVRYAFPKPGGDYHKMARESMRAFFDSTPQKEGRVVPAKGRVVLDPAMDASVVSKDILVHGWYEFEIDQPARVSVFQRNVGDESVKVVDTLPKLPRILPGHRNSGAGRGLFLASNIDVTPKDAKPIDSAGGIRQIVVADGNDDPWMTGRDQLTEGKDHINKGNYGRLYRIKIPITHSDGRGIAVVVINGRSTGDFCKWLGLVMRASAGEFPAGTVMLPADRPRFTGLPEGALVQRFAPPADGSKSQTIELTYTPPGASCLPTPILLVPYEVAPK